MNSEDSYCAKAKDYAKCMRSLLTPTYSGTSEKPERGERSQTYRDLEEKAENLYGISSDLAEKAKDLLVDSDQKNRIKASNRLLAKTLSDLMVSSYLLQAADDESLGVSYSKDELTERDTNIVDSDLMEEVFNVLLNGETNSSHSERNSNVFSSVDEDDFQDVLSKQMEECIELILSQASSSCQKAVAGIGVLGILNIAEAAKLIGKDFVEVFTQCGRISKLYELSCKFFYKSLDSLNTLIGPTASHIASKLAIEWLSKLKESDKIKSVLSEIYGTKKIETAMTNLIVLSSLDTSKFEDAATSMDILKESYKQKAQLVINGTTVLKNIGFLGIAVTAAIPNIKLIEASLYLLFVSYILMLAADYLDAESFEFLDRTAGIQRIMKEHLSPL